MPIPSATPKTQTQDAARYQFIFSPNMDQFIAELNKAGAQGYRFSSAVFDWQSSRGSYRSPATLLKLDEGKYEYAFFEIRSAGFYGAGGFNEKYEALAKRGFHLVDRFWVAGGCDFIDADNAAYGMRCDITYMFLLEKLVGGPAVEFHVAGDTSNMRGKPGSQIAAEINEKLVQGFSPVSILSRSQVLLEKIAPGEQAEGEKPHVELVSASTGRMNELGKLGYHVAFVFDERALMYRDSQSLPAGRYLFVTARNSDVQKKLDQLRNRGSVYRAMYRDDHWSGDKLLFEDPIAAGPKTQHEYKVIRLEFQTSPDGKTLRAGDETLAGFHALTAQGFVVRTLFRTNKGLTIGILLER